MSWLGWYKRSHSFSNVGTKVPNLSQYADIINIQCDLVNDSFVDGEESDIIYSFSTSVLRPSFSFAFEPRRIQSTKT